ncbi:hypothetical protein GCM10025870_11300 [Agromyces marinus]|uniref:Uncharacterized protein n=1 Tax=Agromyces marinus TaxID=1389020 RepID=A0ABM8GZY9_9MICO|nr:hypothetical protein GCM10025870_11300 [Agromyces marinus]
MSRIARRAPLGWARSARPRPGGLEDRLRRRRRHRPFRRPGAFATNTPATSTAPPTVSHTFGTCPSSTAADAIATTGASSTHGTTDAERFRASSPLKIA